MPDDFQLPEESIIELIASSGLSTRLICTPCRLRELVIGWLFTQGLIDKLDDIHSLQICDSNTRVLVQIKPNGAGPAVPSEILLSSGCSGGRVLESSFHVEGFHCNSPLTVTKAALVQAIADMYQVAFGDRDSSGLHCAAVVPLENGRAIIADSDIGRHNAVDKVIGASLLNEINFGLTALVTSGRISSDMALKAIRAGIPVIATRRSVTSLAAELAEKTGIAIAARLTRGRTTIVGNTNRIME
jgi:FdhD protein